MLNGDFTRSFLAADLRELDVTTGIHEFTLVTEDTDKVTVEGDHCERIQCYVKDGRLVIKDVGQKDADMNTNDRKICVTVPKDFAWTEADIDAAMASAVIEQLSGAEIELTAGMGTIEIGNIIAD